MSTYSIRKSLSEGKFDFEELGYMNKHFPDIQGLEMLDGQLEQKLEDTEIEDLKKLKERVNKNGLEWFCITTGSFEFGANGVPHYHSDVDYMKGFERVEEFKIGAATEWIENAGELGIKLMRIDGGSFFYNHKLPVYDAIDFTIKKNVNSYNEYCKVASKYGIKIAVENHGGFFADLNILEKLFEKVPDLYLCYDVGNTTDANRLKIIEKFADRISYVHAKTYTFDENGEEANFNFGEIISALKKKGFDGWMSIEYEGPAPTIEAELLGVKKTMELLKKYI